MREMTTSSSSSSLNPTEPSLLTPNFVGRIIVCVLIHECKEEMPSRIPWASSSDGLTGPLLVFLGGPDLEIFFGGIVKCCSTPDESLPAQSRNITVVVSDPETGGRVVRVVAHQGVIIV